MSWLGHRETESNVVGGEWIVSGSGDGESNSTDDFKYNGSGDYFYPTSDGESVTGEILESGGEHFSSHSSWEEQLDDGNWFFVSGEGTSQSNGHDDYSYNGSGSYSDDTTGGTVNGTINEDGHRNATFDSIANQQIGPDHQWHITDGTANSASNGADNWDYHGTGSYLDGLEAGYDQVLKTSTGDRQTLLTK